jgi:hypothetical protein
MKNLNLAAMALVCLTTACSEQAPAVPGGGSPETPTPPALQGPAVVAGDIDWPAAQADLAARPGDVVIPQSVGDGPLLVPMLLPGGIVQTQSDRPTPPRITKDGYFATYHLPRYDVIVNGSLKAFVAAGQAPAADKETARFQTVEAGARLSFSRYGADYEIEFECRQIDSPEGCITQSEAMEFADSLFVAQSR